MKLKLEGIFGRNVGLTKSQYLHPATTTTSTEAIANSTATTVITGATATKAKGIKVKNFRDY